MHGRLIIVAFLAWGATASATWMAPYQCPMNSHDNGQYHGPQGHPRDFNDCECNWGYRRNWDNTGCVSSSGWEQPQQWNWQPAPPPPPPPPPQWQAPTENPWIPPPTMPPTEKPWTPPPTMPPTEKPWTPPPTMPPTEKPWTPPPTMPPTEKPWTPPPTQPPTMPPTEKPWTPPPTMPPTEKPWTPPPTMPPTEKPWTPPTEKPWTPPTEKPWSPPAPSPPAPGWGEKPSWWAPAYQCPENSHDNGQYHGPQGHPRDFNDCECNWGYMRNSDNTGCVATQGGWSGGGGGWGGQQQWKAYSAPEGGRDLPMQEKDATEGESDNSGGSSGEAEALAVGDTAASVATTSAEASGNPALIVVASVAGVALVALVVGFVVYRKRRAAAGGPMINMEDVSTPRNSPDEVI